MSDAPTPDSAPGKAPKLTSNQRIVLRQLCECRHAQSVTAIHDAIGWMPRSSILAGLNGVQLRGYALVESAGAPMTFAPTPTGRLALSREDGNE